MKNLETSAFAPLATEELMNLDGGGLVSSLLGTVEGIVNPLGALIDSLIGFASSSDSSGTPHTSRTISGSAPGNFSTGPVPDGCHSYNYAAGLSGCFFLKFIIPLCCMH